MSQRLETTPDDARVKVLSISLVVLRCGDVATTRRFYEALGLVFQAERHGSAPEHCSPRWHAEGPPGSRAMDRPELRVVV